MAEPRPALVALGVAVAVGAVSAAAIFIRLADAPALAVAFWRNLFAALLLAPFLVVTRGRLPRGRPLALCLLSGVMLAGHFGFWISSLDHTSVAASVVLVCTQPVYVAILARLFLAETTPLLGWVGIGVAVVGTTLIGADQSFGDTALFGNGLALLGAVTVAVYVLLGRSVRGPGTVDLLPYAVVVYSTAAAVLLGVSAVAGVELAGYTTSTWGWLLAIALGPQILGHTLFNWALRYVRASRLSSTILIEPVVSTALAFALLDETPGLLTVAGGAVVLVGVAVVLRAR